MRFLTFVRNDSRFTLLRHLIFYLIKYKNVVVAIVARAFFWRRVSENETKY